MSSLIDLKYIKGCVDFFKSQQEVMNCAVRNDVSLFYNTHVTN